MVDYRSNFCCCYDMVFSSYTWHCFFFFVAYAVNKKVRRDDEFILSSCSYDRSSSVSWDFVVQSKRFWDGKPLNVCSIDLNFLQGFILVSGCAWCCRKSFLWCFLGWFIVLNLFRSWYIMIFNHCTSNCCLLWVLNQGGCYCNPLVCHLCI